MDCSPPGSSIHGISQARILEWVAISFSRGSFWPRDWTHISFIGRQILYHWATWKAKIEGYNFQITEKNGLKKEEKVKKKKEVKEKEKKENTVGQIESRGEPIHNSSESDWILKANCARGASRAAQWCRTCFPGQGTHDQPLSWELRSRTLQGQLSPHTAMKNPSASTKTQHSQKVKKLKKQKEIQLYSPIVIFTWCT